jgi:hypothetical protein
MIPHLKSVHGKSRRQTKYLPFNLSSLLPVAFTQLGDSVVRAVHRMVPAPAPGPARRANGAPAASSPPPPRLGRRRPSTFLPSCGVLRFVPFGCYCFPEPLGCCVRRAVRLLLGLLSQMCELVRLGHRAGPCAASRVPRRRDEAYEANALSGARIAIELSPSRDCGRLLSRRVALRAGGTGARHLTAYPRPRQMSPELEGRNAYLGWCAVLHVNEEQNWKS